MNAIDPTGESLIVVFSLEISLRGLIQAAIFVAVAYLLWKLIKPVYARLAALAHLATAPLLSDDMRKTIITQIDTHWGGQSNKKMQKLKFYLTDHLINVKVLPNNKWVEGLYFGRQIGVPQRAIDEEDFLALTLVTFGEWQHHPEGGGMKDTQVTQDEFNKVRKKIDDRFRTDYVNRIHHGGTINSY